MIDKIKNSLPTKEQIKIVYPDIKEKDLELLLHISEQTGLNILRKQIWAIPRGGRTSIETSIDGFRLIAERTGRYAPGKEPGFEYDDKKNLIKATAYVKKMTEDGTWHEVSVSAMMSEYNANQGLWRSKPHVMLSKCAEMQALRRAFPDALSGVYGDDEMGQASKYINSEDAEKIKFLIAELSEEKCNSLLKILNVKDFEKIEKDRYSKIYAFVEKYVNNYIKENNKQINEEKVNENII